MKKFLFNLFLFSLPFILLFAFPLSVFLMSGEFLPVNLIVENQQRSKEEVKYLSAITSSTDRPYKFSTLTYRNPEIAVLGTSRTLTIESKFFKDPTLFYNAGYNGGTTLRTKDLITFIEKVPEDSKMHVLLFDASGYITEAATGPVQEDNLYGLLHAFFISSWRTIYLDYFHGKFSFLELIRTLDTNQNMGISAHLYGQGYRKDGSLERNIKQTPFQLQKEVERKINTELNSIGTPTSELRDYSDSIPQQDIDTIKQFLELCKEKNIYVVGYFSPYASEIDQKMRMLPNGYGNSYRKAPLLLTPLFEENGFPFYDLRDLSTIDSSDSELYDPHHPTEKATLRLLAFLTNREPILQTYLNVSQLHKQISVERY